MIVTEKWSTVFPRHLLLYMEGFRSTVTVLARIRLSHQFHDFLQFFFCPGVVLSCLIWCLWPLKKNISRNELNKLLNASSITKKNRRNYVFNG